jgi:hypothetical protein
LSLTPPSCKNLKAEDEAINIEDLSYIGSKPPEEKEKVPSASAKRGGRSKVGEKEKKGERGE